MRIGPFHDREAVLDPDFGSMVLAARRAEHLRLAHDPARSSM
jgi:hypothetical protein